MDITHDRRGHRDRRPQAAVGAAASGDARSASRRASPGCCSRPTLRRRRAGRAVPARRRRSTRASPTPVLASCEPTKWIGLRELPSPDPRHDRSATRSWTTVKFTVITVVFEFVLGMIIALVVNSNFKGRGLMRAAMLVPVGDPDRRLRPDVEVDVPRHLRRRSTTCWSASCTSSATPSPGSRSRARRSRPLRGRHLEDDALRRAAAARGPAGHPARSLRGGQRRRRQPAGSSSCTSRCRCCGRRSSSR